METTEPENSGNLNQAAEIPNENKESISFDGNLFDSESSLDSNKIASNRSKTPSVQDDISITRSEIVLRPHNNNGERKRVVSAMVVPSRASASFKRSNSSVDSNSLKVSRALNKKGKNGNMVLRLVLPENHINDYENNNSSTPRLADDTTGKSLANGGPEQQTYSICSQHDYPAPTNTAYINHAYSVGDFGFSPPKTPGGFSSLATSAPSTHVPDEPTPHDKKKRAFLDILTKTLCLFYALFNITLGLAVYVADIVDGSHPTAEIFSLILVIISAIYIIYLTVDISMFMNRKRKYEKLLEKNMPEKVEMMRTPDGQFQFNIVLPEIIKVGKSIKHNYCFNKDRHSTNFYLKVGAAAFCFGHLIHSGLLLGYQIVFLTADDNKFYECASIPTLILDFVYPFYSFFLLFFIFKYSNVIINRNIILARFGVMHCLSSSICFWVWTIFREVVDASATKAHDDEASTEGTTAIDDHPYTSYALPVTSYNERGAQMLSESFNFSLRRFTAVCDYRDESIKAIYRDISPYLYPFSVEYSILVVGVLYLVWQNIGMCSVEDENEASTSQCRTPSSSPENTESNVVLHVDCHSSNKGLFGGFVVLIITVVCCILFFMAVYKDNGKKAEIGITINLAASLIILTTMILACVVGYRQITKLDLNSAHHNLLDDVLLFICIPAFFLNGIFSIIPAIINGNVLGYITLIVEIVQVLIQTVFILDGLRRSSNTRKLRKNKPGRELVTFLVISNISLWLMETFAVKAHELKDERYDFYGKELWTILGHMCLPLMMFYRFHSSVCFGDIWKYAYERSGH